MFDYLFSCSKYEYRDAEIRLLNVRTKIQIGTVEANRWFSYVDVDFIRGIMVLHQGGGCIKLALTLNYQLLSSETPADVVMGDTPNA